MSIAEQHAAKDKLVVDSVIEHCNNLLHKKFVNDLSKSKLFELHDILMMDGGFSVDGSI